MPCGAVGWTSTGSASRSISGPDRREAGIGEIAPVDVGQNHDPDRAGRDAARELLFGVVGELPRQRREPADAVRPPTLLLGHRLVDLTGSAQTDLPAAPVHIGRGERDDRYVHAGPVHVRDAPVVVPHFREQRHERRIVEVDRVLAGPCFLDRAFVSVPAQQLQIFERQHVG
ncbi:MAG: hypothetical protein ACREUE_16225, partial [Panacagrimonas sp.]